MRFPDPLEYPDIFGEDPEAVQENVAPATCDCRDRPLACPLQMVWEGGTKNTSATGNTVTTKSVESPVQPFAVAATR